MTAESADISLAASNIGEDGYIKVKVGEGEWTELTANTDATLWFNVEAANGVRSYEVKTKDGKVYTATLDWNKAIKTTATWTATGGEGIRPGTEDKYVEYKLMDGANQVSFKVGEAKLFASKTDDKWKSHELNTDTTLWLKKDVSGTFTYFIVAQDGTMYKTILEYTAPAEPVEPIETKSTVVRNSTGGAESTFNAETLTFGGKIAYYLANSSSQGNPPTDGNYVGVTITAPEGVAVDAAKATFKYTNQAGEETTLVNSATTWLDGTNFVNYYPKVTTERKEFTVVIDWDGEGTAYAPETIIITVSEDATLKTILKAPEDGLTELTGLNDVTAAGAKFLVFGLNTDFNTDPDVGPQKPSTLVEVKTFIEAKYNVTFNSDKIVVTDGKIAITGSILSTADWNKIKESGGIPGTAYRITLVKDSATTNGNKGVPAADKVAKVAIYEDGNAVIESTL